MKTNIVANEFQDHFLVHNISKMKKHEFLYHSIADKKKRRQSLEARIAAIIANADHTDDECISTRKIWWKEIRFGRAMPTERGSCPLGCGSVYNQARPSPGHQHKIRVCLLILLLENTPSTYQNMIKEIEDKEISHFCCVRTDLQKPIIDPTPTQNTLAYLG